MAIAAKSFSSDIQAFIKVFSDDIRDGAAAVFAGAGLSVDSGFVNWADLLREIAEELGLDVDREHNLAALAQYHVNERRNRSRINQKLIDEFSAGHSINQNHEILARLPIETYWTTNYDCLIETALTAAGKVVDVKSAVRHLKKVQRGRQATVYKMHGDVGDPDRAVLTKDDYESYFRDREPFVTALAGDLVSKTMLFVGFSFTDPNIDYVMSRIRVVLHSAPKQHYCILRRAQRRKREKRASFQYRQHQQNYFVKDLQRIGVHALMVDEYSDIKRILHAIEACYRNKCVFISGSAAEYAPWSPDKAGQFLESLSAALVAKGLIVVTGFGLGVGASIIAGALSEIMLNPKSRTPNQLQAHPFPANTGSATVKRSLYTAIRKTMIGKAGIAIFLFGNKRDAKGRLERADGMLEELSLARAEGLHVIAVGATGWIAEHIAASLASDARARTPAFRKAFAVANDANAKPTAIVKAVIAMVIEYGKVLRG